MQHKSAPGWSESESFEDVLVVFWDVSSVSDRTVVSFSMLSSNRARRRGAGACSSGSQNIRYVGSRALSAELLPESMEAHEGICRTSPDNILRHCNRNRIDVSSFDLGYIISNSQIEPPIPTRTKEPNNLHKSRRVVSNSHVQTCLASGCIFYFYVDT